MQTLYLRFWPPKKNHSKNPLWRILCIITQTQRERKNKRNEHFFQEYFIFANILHVSHAGKTLYILLQTLLLRSKTMSILQCQTHSTKCDTLLLFIFENKNIQNWPPQWDPPTYLLILTFEHLDHGKIRISLNMFTIFYQRFWLLRPEKNKLPTTWGATPPKKKLWTLADRILHH